MLDNIRYSILDSILDSILHIIYCIAYYIILGIYIFLLYSIHLSDTTLLRRSSGEASKLEDISRSQWSILYYIVQLVCYTIWYTIS